MDKDRIRAHVDRLRGDLADREAKLAAIEEHGFRRDDKERYEKLEAEVAMLRNEIRNLTERNLNDSGDA